jgi:hypothetical protein
MRQTSRYALQKDGLRIQYEFVDVETYIMPPLGTIKAAAKYRETCANGAIRFGEVTCSVVGNFRTSRQDLIIRAISVALQRLERAGIVKSEGRWKATGAFEEDLYEPKVSVQLRAMIRPPAAAFDGGRLTPGNQGVVPNPVGVAPINIPGIGIVNNRLEAGFQPIRKVGAVNVPGKPSIFAGWGEVPWGSETGLAPDPGIRGTAGLALLAAALNDPCLSQTVLNAGLTSAAGSFGAPQLLPQNTDPASSQGGGAGAPVQNPDPFFNPNQFIGQGR